MDPKRVSALEDAEDILFDLWMKTPSAEVKLEWRMLLHAWRYIKSELEKEKAYDA